MIWPAKFRFWPDTLFAQLAGVVVLNLLAVQAVTFLLYRLESDHLPMAIRDLPDQIVTMVQLLDNFPPAQRPALARNLSTDTLAVSILPSGETPPLTPPLLPHHPPHPPFDPMIEHLRVHIIEKLGADAARPLVLYRSDSRPGADAGASANSPETETAFLAIGLKDGGWLQVLVQHVGLPFRFMRILPMIFGTTATIGLLSLLFARRLAAPLARFARAADQLGRSVETPELPEIGPRELRQATRAFNLMQKRLRRFVQDRTQMLAAISHDLRTPLTRMRLRAELALDDEQRDKMLRDIADMDDMISATLVFARDDSLREARRPADLDALLQDLTDGLIEAGQEVEYQPVAPLNLPCSPLALRRAFSNLLNNAVKYGHRARIALRTENQQAIIKIEDDGPGIPDAFQEQVFQPFFRLEGSRNRDTGGVGLGLAVARTIIQGHGGTIGLANRPAGGLTVTVSLPV